MILYTYPMQERLTACLLLIGLLGQSCGQLIEPEIRELSETAYTEGKLTCKEVADKEESNSLVLAAPPYRPMTSPNQCAQVYEGELQNSPYDLGQGGSDKGYEGEGGRKQIANPTEWPYLFHSQLEIRFPHASSPYGGSGVLVGPQHILTAAHNVYQQDRKVWADQVVVRLALHDNVAPYGAIATSRIYACKGWTGGGDGAYDLALLVLDKPIGYQTGWCGLLGASSQELEREEVHITGYPGDKGYKQLWGMSGFIKEVQPERLIYGIATSPGQSGSGIWLDKWGSPYVVGVHARGGNALANIGNTGVRLSYAKAKQVIGWINQTLSIQETFKKNLLQAKSGKEEEVVEESASIKQGVKEGIERKEGIGSSLLPSPLKDRTVSRVTIDALVTAVKEGHSQALLRLLDLSHANAYVQFSLGKLYEEGVGVKKDLKQAVGFYEESANQGDADAQNKLGVMYYEGEGLAKDYKKAVEWWEKAANQGYAAAQNNLGWMYKNGQGVAKDYKKAVEWLEKAANQGYAAAQNNLGTMYANGEGVSQDDKKAVEWLEKAANQGNADAQNNLGVMYQYGEGVSQDYQKAVDWFEKAASQGNADAQFNLGKMYENGKGVAQDYQKAVEWFEKAANQGHAAAQFKLY